MCCVGTEGRGLVNGFRQADFSLSFQYDEITFESRTPMIDSIAPRLADYIREIPDFPKPGIRFKDITPLLAAAEPFRWSIEQMADHFRDQNVELVIAAEARGFIFATPLAMALGVGFVPVRKPGKLPYQRHSHTYDLEYGTDTLEMHVDGIAAGQRVLIVDDLLATGGTVSACCEMVERCEAEVCGCAFLIELKFLHGARRLAPRPVFSLIQYDE